MDSNQIKDSKEVGGRMVKSILSKSTNMAVRKAAASIRNGADIGEALQFVSEVTGGQTNTLVGNLFTIIGQQWVETHFKEIYGNVFKRGEDTLTGSISIVLPVNNGAGITTPTNYQTSTLPTGQIAFGASVSNADMINIVASMEPLSNLSSTGQLSYVPFATFDLTIPSTFAAFSGLTAIKAGEIISTYNETLSNSLQIYYNALGNLLFTNFMPKNQYTTTSTDLYTVLQRIIMPMIERMKQLSARYNAGINYTSLMTNPTDNTYFQQLDNLTIEQLRGQTWVNVLPQWETCNNSISANQPYLNNTRIDKMVMYMNPTTMAAFLSLLETNAIGRNVLDIQTQGNVVTRLGGVKVVVTGTLVNNSPQTPQGTTITPALDSGQALADGEILLINEDYLTFHNFYDKYLTTDQMVNAMVTIVRHQVAYLPILRPWLNGILLNINSALNTPTALNVNILQKVQ